MKLKNRSPTPLRLIVLTLSHGVWNKHTGLKFGVWMTTHTTHVWRWDGGKRHSYLAPRRRPTGLTFGVWMAGVTEPLAAVMALTLEEPNSADELNESTLVSSVSWELPPRSRSGRVCSMSDTCNTENRNRTVQNRHTLSLQGKAFRHKILSTR